jgi:uncharacterized protein (TIGR00255 family)
MTGYGAVGETVAGRRLTIEIRSVNARFLELRIALPREHQALESELRKIVQAAIDRGRVEVTLRRERRAAGRPSVAVDMPLAREVLAAWRRVARALDLSGEIDLGFLRGAGIDVVRVMEDGENVSAEAPVVRRLLQRALAAHDRERRREGAHLASDMRKRARTLSALRVSCKRLALDLRPVLAERLRSRVTDLLGAQMIEPARLVQEVALAVDRSDISEEIARLESHLTALNGLLSTSGSVGKRIEFLLQEILREVNTIGSKSNHLPLTQLVLDAKAEIEKLREQVANVE